MLSRTARIVIALIFVFEAAPAPALLAQEKAKPAEQDQVVRLKTELLQVRAVVTDKQGRLVDGLKAEDFEVTENDRPQRVEFFSVERTARPTAGPARPEPIGPPRPAVTTTPGRTVVLFVDTLHLSDASLLRAKQSLKQFIREQLTANDLAAIVTSGGQMGLFNQFTTDRRLLLYAVDRLQAWGRGVTKGNFTPYLAAAVDRGQPGALELALEILKIEEGYQPAPGMDPRPYVRSRARQVLTEIANYRKATLLTLKETVKRMAELPGQRIIAFLSDGFSLITDAGNFDTGELNATINKAVVSGVVIYSLYGKGLETSPVFDASNRVPASNDYFSYASASVEDHKNGLNALAKDTGGETFFNTNDITGSLKKVVENNEVYYVLAYYPESDGGKDKYRRIKVRLKGHPDYSVRAQKGYMASDLRPEKSSATETPQQKLVAAVSSPLPVTAIGITASADFLETDADEAQATVQVHVDAATLEYKQAGERFTFDIDLVIFVLDQSGKVAKGINNELKGSLTAERVELAKQNGLRFTTRLQLKPGQYQARVGAREISTSRMGTAMALLEVPDLKKRKLAISGLFLSESQASGDQAARQGDNLEFYDTKVVRGLPVFKKGGNLICSFFAYNAEDKEEKGSETVLQVALMREGQEVYLGEWVPLKSRVLARGMKGVLVGLQMKLTTSPGLYEMQVRVKDSKSKKSLQQSVLFEVAA